MEENGDESLTVSNVDTEINQLLGLFDAPAFVRRGHELDHALNRMHLRLQRERNDQLEMVRLRLRQWSTVATAQLPQGEIFRAPLNPVWTLSGAEPPTWAATPAARHRRRSVARDLVASMVRFNKRWQRFIEGFNLEPINQMVEHYNRYYVLEKECCMGSAKLAARFFVPKARISHDQLLEHYPLLPIPELQHDSV